MKDDIEKLQLACWTSNYSFVPFLKRMCSGSLQARRWWFECKLLFSLSLNLCFFSIIEGCHLTVVQMVVL